MSSSRLLIVDDDEDIRVVLRELLTLEGYEVSDAVDGLDALQRIRASGKPSLVLLDLRMPRMSGPEFLEALRADPGLADIPVLVISGDGRARETARSLGVSGFLPKPVDSDRLLGMVRRCATGPPPEKASASPAPR